MFECLTLLLGISNIFCMTKAYKAKRNVDKIRQEYDKLLSQKKSSETRLGQISEHFAPMLAGFPYDTKETRFLGSPIDFVVFDIENDQIVFVEFKTGGSQLTKRQRAIRDIVSAGNVHFEVMRVNQDIKIKREKNMSASSRLTEEGLQRANGALGVVEDTVVEEVTDVVEEEVTDAVHDLAAKVHPPKTAEKKANDKA
jgi:hypothetical protein